MSRLKIDLDANELKETPIIPKGTIVTVQIVGEPEMKESGNNAGEHYLNMTLDVVDAADADHVGCSIFHMVSIPSPVMKKRMLSENKTKGWKFMGNNWAVFTAICKVNKVDFDTQRLIGKKFKVVVDVETYKEKPVNRVGDILEAV